MREWVAGWIESVSNTIAIALVTSIVGSALILYVTALYLGYVAFVSGDFATVGNIGSLAGATATLFLVVITAWYAYSTNKHVQLANRRLDHEIRQHHSETLRRRVNQWLGDPISNPLDDSSMNIPSVTTTKIESAPPIVWIAGEKAFRVIPEAIEGDPYLEDLLANHAHDLNNVKEAIEELYPKFEELKSEFQSEYDDTRSLDSLPFPSEKGHYFESWAFERILILERGVYDKSGLHDIAEAGVEKETHAHEGLLHFPGDNVRGGTVIKVPRDVADKNEGVREAVVEVMNETIDRLDDHEAYSIGKEAAVVLDEAEERCEELRNLLIHYKGRQIFPGDCEYLENLRIGE